MQYTQDISDFIFIRHDPQPADIIFIPGNSYSEPAEHAALLWKQGFSKKILPSGKYSVTLGHFEGSQHPEKYTGAYKTEWDYLSDILIQSGVDKDAILKENQATYTFENAIRSRQITDALSLHIKRAILCCKAFHARRCLMYYETLYPDTQFFVCPSIVHNITPDNWNQSDLGIDLVLGELMRCGSQFDDILKKKL